MLASDLVTIGVKRFLSGHHVSANVGRCRTTIGQVETRLPGAGFEARIESSGEVIVQQCTAIIMMILT